MTMNEKVDLLEKIARVQMRAFNTVFNSMGDVGLRLPIKELGAVLSELDSLISVLDADRAGSER